MVWDEFLANVTRDAIANMAEKIEIVTSDLVGGAYYTGATIEELADNMNAAGYETHQVHKANLVKTVEEYNAAAKAGTAAELEVPRVTQEAVALENGPFLRPAHPQRRVRVLRRRGRRQPGPRARPLGAR